MMIDSETIGKMPKTVILWSSYLDSLRKYFLSRNATNKSAPIPTTIFGLSIVETDNHGVIEVY